MTDCCLFPNSELKRIQHEIEMLKPGDKRKIKQLQKRLVHVSRLIDKKSTCLSCIFSGCFYSKHQGKGSIRLGYHRRVVECQTALDQLQARNKSSPATEGGMDRENDG